MIFRNFIEIVNAIWKDDSNRGERLRRLAIFVGWQIFKRTIAKPIVLNLFNGYRFIAYPDDAVYSGALYIRIPESREVMFLRKHLNGGVMIDVGANVGLLTLSLADKVDHAILFEPNPLAAQRAIENMALNRFKFEINALALSDAEGQIFLEDRGGELHK